jgi:uncharacterized protein (DUF1800 family)
MAGQSDRWVTTARVLRRTGFGTTGAQVDAVVARDWPAYVDAALSANPEADPGAVTTPMPVFDPPKLSGKGAMQAARKQYNQELYEQMSDLSNWWLRSMVAVQQPIHEKLTLLWHNHFATSAEKVRFAPYMAAQNQKLRSLSLGISARWPTPC